MEIKTGLIGVGHLGKIHLQCLLQIEGAKVAGIYDIDQKLADEVARNYSVKAFSDLDKLLEVCDAIDIVTPTSTHFEIAKKSIEQGKHIFVEKPVTSTVEEARQLLSLAEVAGTKVQVGHVERFNPAMLATRDIILEPRFIEVHRLAQFNPRGTDVSVVLDLMIHDLDIIIYLVKGEIKRIVANGVNVVSDTTDICNARIEWENGCVANVTASRISMKNMRKMRLFQRDAYISLDFLEKETQIIKLLANEEQGTGNLIPIQTKDGTKFVHITTPDIKPVNAIQLELETFFEAIIQDKKPQVSLYDATKALEAAYQIQEQLSSIQ